MNRLVEVVESSQYKQGLKSLKHKHRKLAIQNLHTVILYLVKQEPLPSKYKPHKLKGVKDTWECHVESDVLLTWRYEENTLVIYLKLLNLTDHDTLSRKAKLNSSNLIRIPLC